ncbi:hypothetical protein GOEFS_069_00150 [Gordonia effusa NBRC 100432]|uniref:Diacylglycerol O-acyltransferase n=1 Tax=Gordonia effusa NBRC 100432 TaxID=1077974 RepID=H0R1D8_9ACTN|nr:hypothetical protein [Gordonia effusa]GAB18889.1 hypothetical protein GOEFS_069_00150 [Gordonia effusa NBRC 100432]
MGTSAHRLTADDNLFVVMEHALGIPVINQSIWRLGPEVDEAFVANLAANLRTGRLSRLVIRRRLPLRDRWIHTPSAGIHRFDSVPVSPEAVSDWARAQLDAKINSATGPAWSLTATRTTDGNTLVSLVVSHVVGDGAAFVTGVNEAVQAAGVTPPTAAPTLVDDFRDGADLLRSAARAAVRVLRAGGPPSTPPELEHNSPTTGTLTVPASIAVTLDAATFDAVAAAAGGTPNTLFSAIVLGVLTGTGRVKSGDTVPLSLPVSTRATGDDRANATTSVVADIVVTDDRYTDLSAIRRASKAAFAGLDDGPDAMGQLVVLAQALPDTVIRRLAASMSTPQCLASNLGELDPTFASLGSTTAGPVAMRSLPVGVPAEKLAAMRGGISAWASRSAGLVTLCVGSLDPVTVPTDGVLRQLVDAELSRWNLTATPWL